MDYKFDMEDVEFDEEPFCEHCMELEPYTATVDVDGCEYCFDCVKSSYDVDKQDAVEVRMVELAKKIDYHNKMAFKCREMLKSLMKNSEG